MPKLFSQLSLKDPDTGKAYSVSAEFGEEELAVFTAFLEACDALFETAYLTTGPQASVNVKYERDKGTSVTATLPSRDVVDAYLYRFRPFVLQNERTHFGKVCGIIGKKLADPLIHLILRNIRDVWGAKRIREVISIEDNFGILTSDETTMQWLNAYEYHRDDEKQARLEPARQFWSDDGLRAFFLNLMTEKAKAIGALGEMIELILGRRKELTLDGLRRNEAAG